MKAAIIINKSAGSESTDDEKIIMEAFHKLNVETEFFKFVPEKISDIINDAWNKGCDVIVTSGGDGTVSAAASVIAGSGKVMAVLPSGTLNHFAKDLGMPVDIAQAVETIVSGKVKLLDIAEVNGKIFINNSSIGLYPDMVKKRITEQKKRKTGKWFAMFLAMINVLKKLNLYDIEITVDDKSSMLRTPFVFVGNNKYEMELFNPGVRTRLDEGVLTLYTSRCTTRWCLLKLSFLSLINMLDPVKEFEIDFVKELTLKAKRKSLSVSADGEVLNMDEPLVYKIIPQTLSVIAPSEKNA